MLCSLYYGRSVINVGMVYVCEGCSYASVRDTYILLYGFILGAIIAVHMMVNHLKSCTLLLVR